AGLDLSGEGRELLAHDIRVERCVAAGTEYPRKKLGLNLAEHDVRVGHGERPVAAVGSGPGLRAGRIRPHPIARAVEMQYRAAAGSHGVNAHHRGAYTHAGDQRFERALEVTAEMRNVGGSASHVEADDAIEAGRLRRSDRSHHSACGTRQYAVLASDLP